MWPLSLLNLLNQTKFVVIVSGKVGSKEKGLNLKCCERFWVFINLVIGVNLRPLITFHDVENQLLPSLLTEKLKKYFLSVNKRGI